MPIETKAVIAEAYLQLAKKKGPDKVSVKDISEVCKISRQAFYYHFQDVPDLIQWIFERKLTDTAEAASRTEDPRQALMLLIDSFTENDALIKKLLISRYYDQLHQIFFKDLQSCIIYLINQKRPDLALSHENTKTALVFFTYGLTGVLLDHIEDKQTTSQQLAERLLAIFNTENKVL